MQDLSHTKVSLKKQGEHEGYAAPVQGEAVPNSAEKPAKKQGRTRGLWLVDTLIYPILNNVAVFLISVGATYLTNEGDKVGGPKWFQSFGKWMHGRGKVVTDFLTKDKIFGVFNGMSEKQANETKMVFFSFLDGSLMAPVIKLIEDRRGPLARKLDKMMGTVPADDSIYDAEPKQTWTSVLLGRAATAAIVVPTAVAMDKAGKNEIFYRGGKKLESWFREKKPKLFEKFPGVNFSEIFRVSLFEAFYTSVCTAGLYVSSRFIARAQEKLGKPKSEAGNVADTTAAPAAAAPPPKPYEVETSVITDDKEQQTYRQRHVKAENNVEVATRGRSSDDAPSAGVPVAM